MGAIKYKKHELLVINFFDHTKGDYGVVEITVVGFFVTQDNKSITVSNWLMNDADSVSLNYELSNIFKKCIIGKIKRLKY